MLGCVGAGLLIGSPVYLQGGDNRSASVPGNVAERSGFDADLEQGWSNYSQKDWAKAISAFDRAIAANPKSPLPYVGRAYVFNAQGKYEQGSAELWRVIRLNPSDAGLTYDPSKQHRTLTAAALQHGETQVRKMLRDRPAMAKYVRPGDRLWQWAVRQFAGKDVKKIVYWDASDPSPLTSDAEQMGSGGTYFLQVQSIPESPARDVWAFDQLWSCVVFEFQRLAAPIHRGKDETPSELSAVEEYCLMHFRADEIARQRTRAFYLKAYLPWVNSSRTIPTDPRNWQFYRDPPVHDLKASTAFWKRDPRWNIYSAWHDLVAADAEYRKENYEKARELLDNAEHLSRWQRAWRHNLIGWIHREKEEFPRALEEFASALALQPNFAGALLGRGIVYHKSSRLSEAVAEFEAGMQIDPENSELYSSRGEIWYETLDYDRAIADFNEALRLDPKSTLTYHWRGNTWVAKASYEKALLDYDAAIRLDPTRGELYLARGIAWYKLYEIDQAIPDFDRAIALDPQDAEAFCRRANAWTFIGNDANAIADLREAARLAPENQGYQSELAVELATCPDKRQRNGTEAVAAATKACELSAWKDWHSISTLAYALAEAGKYDEAVERMKEAFSLYDENDEAKRKELSDILKQFRKGKSYHRGVDSLLDSARWLHELGKRNQALRVVDRAKQLAPDSPLPYACRGEFLIAEGNFDEGIAELWEAIRRNPGDLGPSYDPAPKGELTREALQHGEQQLRKMLRDRPAMAESISPNDELWKWAVRQFAGENTNEFVYWNPSDPNPLPGMCGRDDDRLQIWVGASDTRANRARSLSFDQLWSSAVFELHNVANYCKDEKKLGFVDAGAEEFCKRSFMSEEPTTQQTRAFYLKRYLPWLQSKNQSVTEPARWLCSYFPPQKDPDALVSFWKSDPRWPYYCAGFDVRHAGKSFRQGNGALALAILEDLKTRVQDLDYSDAAWMHYLLGQVHRSRLGDREAVDEFTAALKLDPSYRYALLERGRIFFAEGELLKAIEDFTGLIKQRSDWPEVFYKRGQAYSMLDQPDRAIADFDAAIRLSPEASYFVGRGEAHHLRDDFDRAVADFTEAIRLEPGEYGHYLARSAVYGQQQKFAEMIADLREAVRIAPDATQPRMALARELAMCPEAKYRDAEEAIKIAKELCEQSSWTDAEAIDVLGCAFAQAGQFDEAVKRIEQAIELTPQNLSWRWNELSEKLHLFRGRQPFFPKSMSDYQRGLHFLMINQWDRAMQAFERAKAQSPESPFPYTGRGMVLIERRQFREGIAEMWQAIQRSKNDVGLSYNPAPTKTLSAEALKHGERQLRSLLKDRPVMAEHVRVGDRLWNWTVRQFAGEGSDRLIDWEPDEMKSVQAATAAVGKRGKIRLSATSDLLGLQPRGFDELWSDLVFQLQLIASSQAVSTLADRVLRGEVTCDEHNVKIMEAEEVAAQRTRAFYLKVYLPWLGDRPRCSTDPRNWRCDQFAPSDRSLRLQEWKADLRWNRCTIDFELLSAKRCYQQKDYIQLRKILDSLRSRVPFERSSEMHFWLGCLCDAEGDSQQARREFSTAFGRDRSLFSAILESGKEQLLAERIEAAAEELTRLAARSAWPAIYLTRGMAFLEAKDYDRAVADFSAALQLNNKFTDALVGRGIAWMLDQDLERAMADLDAAIRLDSTNGSVFTQRAEVWCRLGKFDSALADHREAVRISPNLPAVQNNFAWFLATCPDRSVRDGKAAVEAATKACELSDWEGGRFIDTLAAALAEKGEFDEAVKRIDEAIDKSEFEDAPTRRSLMEHRKLFELEFPHREQRWKSTDEST